MPYRSPKSGSVVNPKRKKMPKGKVVSSKTQKKNRRKLAKDVLDIAVPLSGLTKVYKVAKNKYKEGE
tara:strand:- start:224 stop:424 length:201 start_codon:yes stop_codon:yes gene_type:complete